MLEINSACVAFVDVRFSVNGVEILVRDRQQLAWLSCKRCFVLVMVSIRHRHVVIRHDIRYSSLCWASLAGPRCRKIRFISSFFSSFSSFLIIFSLYFLFSLQYVFSLRIPPFTPMHNLGHKLNIESPSWTITAAQLTSQHRLIAVDQRCPVLL